jgi:hypothetical protein
MGMICERRQGWGRRALTCAGESCQDGEEKDGERYSRHCGRCVLPEQARFQVPWERALAELDGADEASCDEAGWLLVIGPDPQGCTAT